MKILQRQRLLLSLSLVLALAQAEDIGPDTCGQDRGALSSWYMSHGMPSLVLDPAPPLFGNVTENPYDNPNNPPLYPNETTGFCAMKWDDTLVDENGLKMYYLSNFTTEAEAAAAGYNVTHRGHCGACSSLQDLGVYMSQNLTEPTRLCGALGIISEELEGDCMRLLGFSEECLSIWLFNIHNTRAECREPCIEAWIHNEPNNKPDGSLNDCLQCDEDKSGPNFQYFSGRTRRNSGIPSAISRPPEQFYNMEHCYWYGELPPAQNQTESPFEADFDF